MRLEKFSLIVVLIPIFKAKQKMHQEILFMAKKIDLWLSSKFQGNVFGSTKG